MKALTLIISLAFSVNSFSQTATEFYNRGVNKFKLEDYLGAIADFNIGIELNPKDEMTYYNRGNSKSKLGDHRGAITDYNIAIDLNPKYASAYLNRGILKFIIKQKNSGCLDLSKAGELGKDEAYDLIKKFCQ